MKATAYRTYVTKSRAGHYWITLVHVETGIKACAKYGHPTKEAAIASEKSNLLEELTQRVTYAQSHSGFSVYVGRNRLAWTRSEDEAIRLAVSCVKKEHTENGFVPSVTVFDQAKYVAVAFVTDDANGIEVHRPNLDAGPTLQALSN